MRYDIRIGRKAREVEISRDEAKPAVQESYAVTMHQQSRKKQSKIVILERNQDRLVLSIENRAYSVIQLKRTPTSVSFVANGRLLVAGLKTRFEEEEGLELGPPVSEFVSATLPAKVVKITVKQGESLKQGKELLVLESMKMEVQLLAPRDCRVREIYVKEGDSVERGKRLIWLDFSER